MTVEQAIKRIKSVCHDISGSYSDEQCIEFLNNAIQQSAALLVGARFVELVREIVLKNGDKIPKNYMVAAGTYPIRMTNGVVEVLDDYDSVRFRYFATPDNLTSDSKELPFKHDAINEVIIKVAVMMLLNENEFDLAQDNMLLEKLEQAIASGLQ